MDLSSLSMEYVRVRVDAREAGVAVVPTADVVKMAFLAGGVTPGASDWKTAAWETDASNPNAPIYYVRCLVAGTNAPSTSGAAIVLAVGTFAVWARITDSPEAPIRAVGILTVT